MKIAINIPASLGEIIYIKGHLDAVKDKYSEIKIYFETRWLNDALGINAADWKQKEILWLKYLDDIGQLFFSESPYVLTKHNTGDILRQWYQVAIDTGSPIKRINLSHLLCKGKSLNLNKKYIVITTKVRYAKKDVFDSFAPTLWEILKQLSEHYIIVILGEKEVEMRAEYIPDANTIFGFYDQIISNLSGEYLLDLTVPALGQTVSDLTQIQQDCLIMKEAEFVITVGIGGNFSMATSVANMTIAWRNDDIPEADYLFEKIKSDNSFITKDYNKFLDKLKQYILIDNNE